MTSVKVHDKIVKEIVVELDHDLDAVEVDLLGVGGHVGQQDARRDQGQGDRRGDDHGDGDGDVTTEAVEGLLEYESEFHGSLLP